MPFKSEKQRKWMHANKPKMAKKWEKKKKSEIKEFAVSANLDKILKNPKVKQLFSRLGLKRNSKEDVIKVMNYFARNPQALNALRVALVGEAWPPQKKDKDNGEEPEKEEPKDKKLSKGMDDEEDYERDLDEAPIWATPPPFSSPEAKNHVDRDLTVMSKHLGKASYEIIKMMMQGVKSGKYDALDLARGIKVGQAKRTHYGEVEFIQQLWSKVRDKFRKYSKRGKLR